MCIAKYMAITQNHFACLYLCRLQPSDDCGPFRGKQYMYTVVNDTISTLNCDGQKAVSFFGSAGFIAPLIVLLL